MNEPAGGDNSTSAVSASCPSAERPLLLLPAMRTLANPGSLSPHTAGFLRPGNGTILFPIAKTLCVVHCLFLFSLVSLEPGSGTLSSPFLCYLYLSCSPLLRSFNSNPTFSLSYWHCYKSSLLSLRKQTNKQKNSHKTN